MNPETYMRRMLARSNQGDFYSAAPEITPCLIFIQHFDIIELRSIKRYRCLNVFCGNRNVIEFRLHYFTNITGSSWVLRSYERLLHPINEFIVVRMRADPKPGNCIIVLYANSTPVNSYSHGIYRSFRMNLLEVE